MSGATTAVGVAIKRRQQCFVAKTRSSNMQRCPGFPRDAGEGEGFLMGLFDPPYPDYDKGIAVYAGNDDQIGRLPPLDAIGTSASPLYEGIARRLAKENYFEVEMTSQVFPNLVRAPS
jgi:hypothetical protein